LSGIHPVSDKRTRYVPCQFPGFCFNQLSLALISLLPSPLLLLLLIKTTEKRSINSERANKSRVIRCSQEQKTGNRKAGIDDMKARYIETDLKEI
jgi:hypothetical protein